MPGWVATGEASDCAAGTGVRRSQIRRRWSGWPVASRWFGEGESDRHVTTYISQNR